MSASIILLHSDKSKKTGKLNNCITLAQRENQQILLISQWIDISGPFLKRNLTLQFNFQVIENTKF